MALSNRERFLATINFQKLDRPFRLETIGFWNETLARWKHEGLPAEYANPATAFLYFGVDLLIPIVLGADQHPGFDPLFNEEIIKETDRTIIKARFYWLYSGGIQRRLKRPTPFSGLPCQRPKKLGRSQKTTRPHIAQQIGCSMGATHRTG